MHLTIVSDDPTLQGTFASICTQIELNYSILTNSISSLGPFLSPFTKNKHVYYIDTRDLHSAGESPHRCRRGPIDGGAVTDLAVPIRAPATHRAVIDHSARVLVPGADRDRTSEAFDRRGHVGRYTRRST